MAFFWFETSKCLRCAPLHPRGACLRRVKERGNFLHIENGNTITRNLYRALSTVLIPLTRVLYCAPKYSYSCEALLFFVHSSTSLLSSKKFNHLRLVRLVRLVRLFSLFVQCYHRTNFFISHKSPNIHLASNAM